MKISYIGTAEQESGFITGSHIFDSTPFTINEEHIEEGYFPTKVKPMEGLRLVYLPKDEKDLTFEPCNTILESVGDSTL